MGIVNAGQLGVYADLDPELRERVEDVDALPLCCVSVFVFRLWLFSAYQC